MKKNGLIILLLLIICFLIFINTRKQPDHKPAPPEQTKQNPELDMKRVRKAWLSWYNRERKLLGLKPYTYNKQLDGTALKWCQVSKERGIISHKRDPLDREYYNYQAIKKWFSEQGVYFKNRQGFTFTENTAWGGFYYQSGDYTDYVIKRIRTSFDMYMREKNKTNKWENAHYRSITAPHFSQIGLGLVIDEEEKGFYLVVHYAAEVTKKP